MLTKSEAFKQLLVHKQSLQNSKINDLFMADPNRFANFSLQFDDILMDFSKQFVTSETMDLLFALASEANLGQDVTDLFNGVIVNKTEQRPAMHTELRNPNTKLAYIQQVLQKMSDFVSMVHSSQYRDILILGIGGSDLGPRLVCDALKMYNKNKVRLHFVANVDSDTLVPILACLSRQHTLCLINSKTFTTIETLTNAKIVKDWFGDYALQSCYAITSSPQKATEFGVAEDNIFEFWDWVGGRYSVWSAVGLPIALAIGMDNFMHFLHGAHLMDQHFLHTPHKNNLPVIMALIGIWNINLLDYQTLCIQPYMDSLSLLPQYLQQLEMESNGKSINNYNQYINYQTAPVIWGGVGCDSQHAYMQMLHQGTQVVPVDFFIARCSHHQNLEVQRILVASVLGQAKALMQGRNTEDYRNCPGNRPSTTLMFDLLTPELLGKILALYEHKVYVQGVIWQIQSFDQWGVQLGKELITDILGLMDKKNPQNVDSSTAGLMQSFLQTN